MRRTGIVVLAVWMFAQIAACARATTTTTRAPESANAYLGQTPPGTTPELFAPGVVSVDGRYEYGLAVSPDGNEIFFTADSPGPGLMVSRSVDGVWTEPQAARLRGDDSWEFEAFFTPDGQKLFFASNEPGQYSESRLWQTIRGADGWGQARRLDSPVNDASVFWATVTRDGTLYYTNVSRMGIYRSRQVNGSYPALENAGLPAGSLHPSVSPDERYILFNSSVLGGFGNDDLFVSFRQGDGSWGRPQNLSAEINTAYSETCASLSPDGHYIFFSRYDEPGQISNIFWVSSAVLSVLEAVDDAQ